MMIVPIITYSRMVKLLLTKIQLRKLDSIERRAREIMGNDVYIPHLEKLIKKKACVVVRKCLDKEICNNFQEYFEINEHNCGTRDNVIMLKCPKVKLEFARQAFRFSAAKIYNELPLQIRAEKDSKIFRDITITISEYFPKGKVQIGTEKAHARHPVVFETLSHIFIVRLQGNVS